MQTALSATMPTPHNSSTGPDKVVQYLLGINDDDVMALTLALFHSKPMHEYCLVSFSETAILVHKRRRNGTQFVYEDWQEFHLTLLTNQQKTKKYGLQIEDHLVTDLNSKLKGKLELARLSLINIHV